MKFHYFLSIIVCLILGACNSSQREALPGEVTVSGVVENPTSNAPIILERLGASGIERIDTTEVDGDKFTFFVKEDAQAFYRINLYDKQYVTFILAGTDNVINITADGSKATGDFSISGSAINDQKDQIDQVEKDFSEKAMSLEQKFLDARENNNPEEMEKLRLEYFSAQKNKNDQMKEAIWKATPNLSAIYGLNYLDATAEFSFMDSVASEFKSSGKLLDYAQSIISRVEKMRRLAIGSPAPEIELPSPSGELIALSSLRGKYVLIDFWAAWCRPCRMENPNVKKMYAAYADKGFEILGVSLDRTRAAWMQAIEKDDLPWKHVSDLKYFNSEAAEMYEIEAIPATYLVDPEGKIIAKGLRGPSLRAKLKEIFG
ncbi:MAG: TlpA disulfide reductase family protein [Bacteroidota bacterium]